MKALKNTGIRRGAVGVIILLALLVSIPAALWAQLPCPIRLGDVGSTVEGVRFINANADNYADLDMATCGDLDGDGLDDFQFSFRCADSTLGLYKLVSGNAFEIGSDGVYDLNPEGDRRNPNAVGISVGYCGDVTGDGLNDILFGAPNIQAEGAAYVVTNQTIQALTKEEKIVSIDWIEANYGVRIAGIAKDDDCGWVVSGAGDFNGDGINDVLIGASAADINGKENAGEVYLIFGGPQLGVCGQLEPERLSGADGVRIQGTEAYGFAGWSIAAAGDLNADGYDDIIIGAPHEDASGENSGAVYIVYGGPTLGAGGKFSLAHSKSFQVFLDDLSRRHQIIRHILIMT